MFKILKLKKKKKDIKPKVFEERLDYIYIDKEMLSGATRICFCVVDFYDTLLSENKVEDNTMYFIHKNRKTMRVAYDAFINND